MRQILAIAKKEWRSTFLSPVALSFLTGFLGASLIIFFMGYKFFSKNVADVRPFFTWMPYLLVILVSAYTMRLWSEEERSQTIEVLLTLPVRLRDVVLGKFLAGFVLVAVALLLTLPVPITVALLGDLDWGPVFGGYMGLLLLAGAYLSIGLFVSSFTDNQIVALMFTFLSCGTWALIGSPWIIDSLGVGATTAEIFRSIGAVGRFESILRGVIDLRDLVYLLSIAVFFLVLNTLVIEGRRWGRSRRARPRRINTRIAVILLGANLLVFNLGISPIMALRVDMTEWDEYSVSDVTKELIRGASEPLLVRGYFSDNTHPVLRPLIPRIRDYLEELDAVGGASLSAEVVDPTKDENVEKEAHGVYGIQNLPVKFEDRHQASVVNAYFSILVRYGDKFEVLGPGDLLDIEEHADQQGVHIQARLVNLEYGIAKAIKKVVYGFQSIESICGRMDKPALLEVFVTPGTLPEEYKDFPGRIEKVAGEIRDRSAGKFDFRIIDPDDPASGHTRESLYQEYGIKPVAVSLFNPNTFYLHMVMKIGEHVEPIIPEGGMTEADIRRGLIAALQRHTPGALKTIGIAVGEKPKPPAYPGAQQPFVKTYRNLQHGLAETYEVEPVDLSSGRVSGEVDVLLVLNPDGFGEKERFAVDQFLMRGGAVVVTAGKFTFEPSPAGQLDINKQETGLDGLLESYGVLVDESIVLDESNAPFPVPVTRDLGGIRIREIQLVQYPPFVRVHDDGLNRKNPATRAIPAVVMHWASPVRCKQGEGLPACQVLLQSSKKAWTRPSISNQPEFEAPEKRESVPLAVTVQGRFRSFFSGKEAPITGGGDEKEKSRRGTVVESSPESARLVVLGSSNFLEDVVLSISSQVSDTYAANLQFMSNLVDWSVEDAALLGIRAKEQYARSLEPIGESERLWWETVNYLFAFLAVVGIGLVTWIRRRRVVPLIPDSYSTPSQQ
jgi:ABC-2 type transport system permease protein